MKIDFMTAEKTISGLLKVASAAGVPYASAVASVLDVVLKAGTPVADAVAVLKANHVDPEVWQKVIDDHRTFTDFHKPEGGGESPQT